MMRTGRWWFLLLWSFAFFLMSGDPASAEMNHPVETRLAAILSGEANTDALVVVYDDMHGLWGGRTITVYGGSGRVERSEREQAAKSPVTSEARLSPEALQTLVAKLLEIRVWEQRTAPREPRPDESRASLYVQVDGVATSIWEWYNDLDAHDRIGRMLRFLESLEYKEKGPV